MITAGYSLFVTSLKFDFLKVIIDYEHYVPLNVPELLRELVKGPIPPGAKLFSWPTTVTINLADHRR